MISPNVDRAESIRLINNIGMSDLWCAITFKDGNMFLHSDSLEEAETMIVSYVISNQDILQKIINALNELRK